MISFTGEKTDVLAGQTALVGRGWHLQVSGQGPLSPIQHGGPRATRSNPGSVGTTAAVVGGKAGTTTSAGVATFGANGGVAGGSVGTGGISADVTGGGIR